MADWNLYFEDVLAELYDTATSSVIGVTATGGASTAANAVDVDQSSAWFPGSGVNTDFRINLGATLGAKTIVAGAVGGHNLSGATITFALSNSTWGTFTSKGAMTLGADDTVLTLTSTATQYWIIRVSASSASSYIGTLSLLTGGATGGQITLTSPLQPRYPLDRSMSPGWVPIVAAGGAPISQMVGAPRQVFTLNMNYAQIASGQTWDTVERLFASTNGFRKGVWFTDDQWTTPGRGFYCAVEGGLGTQVVLAGGRVSGQLVLRTLPTGLGV